MRNIFKASHASLKKDWYGGEKPEDVLVYVEKCAEESEAFGRKVAQQRRSRPQGPAAQGRKNRPYQKASTAQAKKRRTLTRHKYKRS